MAERRAAPQDAQPDGSGRVPEIGVSAVRQVLDDVFQDLRVSIRQIGRQPGWALATIGVLALGIAANTAMFAAFETWILRPLALESPEQLYTVWEAKPAEGRLRGGVSPANLEDWERRQTSFSTLGAFVRNHYNVDDEVEPLRVDGCRIDASLFPLLGAAPILGRNFLATEDIPGQPAAVALLGDRLWRERYGGDPAILGKVIRLDGRVHEIVGIMPEGFAFPEWAEVWTPLGADPVAIDRDARYLTVVGRLRDGVGPQQAEAEMKDIAESLAMEHPESNRGWTVRLESLKDTWVPDVVRVALSASLAAAFLVLLVICATVTGLYLARASARSREFAVRSALGAGRGRLLRLLLTESTLLSLTAGVLGAFLGVVWLDWMLTRAPVQPPYLFRMEVDAGALLWTTLAALVAGAVSSVAPMLHTGRLSLDQALRAGGRVGDVSSGGARLRSVLVVTEVALSTALAIGAFLMVKSFVEQQRVEHGFRTDDVLTMELSLRGEGLETAEQRLAFTERVREELSPVTKAVGFASHLPVDEGYLALLEAEGQPVEPGEGRRASEISVSAGYLEALEIPIERGRAFTTAELRDGGGVALVSEGLARQLWGTMDAVGRRLRHAQGGDEPWLSVVGVVGDVDAGRDMIEPDASRHFQLYRPYADSPVMQLTVVVHGQRPRQELGAELRRAIRHAGVSVPASEVITMREAMDRAGWLTRFFSEQLSLYAVIALVIASLGVYGLVAESVARRNREMAIRLAMGADRAGVVRLVLAQGARLASAGIALGLLLGLPAARSAGAMLAGIDPGDPVILGLVVAVLSLATLLASYLPARRAAAVDPAHTLRSD